MPERCLFYYITDRTQFGGDEPARRRALLEKIAEAARANVDYIQLREKKLSTRELEQLSREAVSIVQKLRTENRELRTRILINSRSDVALAVGADGVHLRSDDISPQEVRRVVALAGQAPVAARPFVVAVSCHTSAEVLGAVREGADFAVFAPVFEKRSAPEIKAQGLTPLHEACKAKIPVLALGGVTFENAARCREAGAAGIAAIRLFQENNVEQIVSAVR